jgi:hypothetical protein
MKSASTSSARTECEVEEPFAPAAKPIALLIRVSGRLWSGEAKWRNSAQTVRSPS